MLSSPKNAVCSHGPRCQTGFVEITWKSSLPRKLFLWFFSVYQSQFHVVDVQSLSCVWLFASLWTAARQASLSFPISWSLLKLMSIELMIPSNHLILCRPFSSCLQSFPASGSFPMSRFFASGGQSIGASASGSVLPVNIEVDFL